VGSAGVDVYTVLGEDELSVLWRVRGPERNDTIASRYHRLDTPR